MFIRPLFVTLVFALAAFGTPLVNCDATGVLQSIQQVDEWTNVFYEKLQKLPTMGILVVNDIETAAMNMDACLKAATDDTNNNEAFTTNRAKEILDVVEKQLESDAKRAFAELVSEQDTVTALGLAPLTESSLQSLQTDANNFENAFISKIPETLKDESKAAIDNILNELSNAISAYSN